MPGSTPTYGFPYPVSTDLVTNGASDMQALAEAVEADMSAIDGRLGTVEGETYAQSRSTGPAAFNGSGWVDVAHGLGVKPSVVTVQCLSHFGDTWTTTVDMSATDANSFRVYGRNTGGAILNQTRTIGWVCTA